ncbi:hypothetical protein G6F35_014549 [Rhizopus arrhizus]|nr:hypothetical protein G6F35_014549 [Rhizopus arrhizus]
MQQEEQVAARQEQSRQETTALADQQKDVRQQLRDLQRQIDSLQAQQAQIDASPAAKRGNNHGSQSFRPPVRAQPPGAWLGHVPRLRVGQHHQASVCAAPERLPLACAGPTARRAGWRVRRRENGRFAGGRDEAGARAAAQYRKRGAAFRRRGAPHP